MRACIFLTAPSLPLASPNFPLGINFGTARKRLTERAADDLASRVEPPPSKRSATDAARGAICGGGGSSDDRGRGG